MNWSIDTHDFGEVPSRSVNYVEVDYLGNEDVNRITFSVSCGCTTPEFNREKRKLKIGLSVSQVGTKTSTVTINSPSGQDFITLKATGI